MQQANLVQAFLSHIPIDGVEFEHNDFVQIVSGVHSGKFGSLVGVIELLPEPEFIVELENGFDVEVFQSELKAVIT
ncbi:MULTISPECIES: hypothetical protein [Deefgea]|uniref:KOW domain-containing protein n=1 Tax=Deefgea chitinilytica TaxID=570276 RepID=A0ABS2CEU8_9NEIS|nr:MULTISPECIES: hypothetical protein [Deefgea]MBM5572670.1 hypothetical protein [Deefgea chitinilytica]MBM9889906.1 hypothetical protein [Deefgea sp. CFH1-16]